MRASGCGPLLAGVLLAGGALDARAAKLPDWAQAIAERAPAVEAGVPEHRSRILLAEYRIAVQPDGRLSTRIRSATQALSVRSAHVGVDFFPFKEGTKIKMSRAWHLPPEGKAKKSSKADWIDIIADDSFLTDAKQRIVAIEGIKRGSIVFFEFQAEEIPYALAFSSPFYYGVPTTLARMELEVPARWSVHHAWLRQPGPEPIVSGNVYRWELRDIPAVDSEPLGAHPADASPRLVVRFGPPAGTSTVAPAFSDWPSLAKWFGELAADRDDVTPEIESVARSEMAGAEDRILDKAGVAARYVRDNVRYVAKEVGIGGYQPRSAAETLSSLYGDCKDKGTLFRSMLAAEGIGSYPVLVNLTTPTTVSPEIPTLDAFNHMIVAIPVPQEAELPPMPALREAGELGRLLFVDTTDEYISFGWLSAALEGKQALVVAGDQSRIVTLPHEDPEAHTIERRLEAEILPGGALSLERTTRYYGDPASAERYLHSQSSRDRQEAAKRELRRVWLDANPTGYSVDPEAADGAFVETLAWTSPGPLPAGSGARVPLFAGAGGDLPRVPLRRRESDVVYDHALTIYSETVLAGMPASATLPSSEERKTPEWEVTTDFTRDGDTVRASCRVVLSRIRFPPEEFRSLRRLYSAMGSATDASIYLPEFDR